MHWIEGTQTFIRQSLKYDGHKQVKCAFYMHQDKVSNRIVRSFQLKCILLRFGKLYSMLIDCYHVHIPFTQYTLFVFG